MKDNPLPGKPALPWALRTYFEIHSHFLFRPGCEAPWAAVQQAPSVTVHASHLCAAPDACLVHLRVVSVTKMSYLATEVVALATKCGDIVADVKEGSIEVEMARVAKRIRKRLEHLTEQTAEAQEAARRGILGGRGDGKKKSRRDVRKEGVWGGSALQNHLVAQARPCLVLAVRLIKRSRKVGGLPFGRVFSRRLHDNELRAVGITLDWRRGQEAALRESLDRLKDRLSSIAGSLEEAAPVDARPPQSFGVWAARAPALLAVSVLALGVAFLLYKLGKVAMAVAGRPRDALLSFSAGARAWLARPQGWAGGLPGWAALALCVAAALCWRVALRQVLWHVMAWVTPRITCVCVSGDGRWVLTGTAGGRVSLWRLSRVHGPVRVASHLASTSSQHPESIAEVRMAVHGRVGLLRTSSGAVSVLDLPSMSLRHELVARGEAPVATACDTSGDGTLGVVARASGTLEIWDLVRGARLTEMACPGTATGQPAAPFATSVAVSRDGSSAVVTGLRGAWLVDLIGAVPGRRLAHVGEGGEAAQACTLSSVGDFALVLQRDGAMVLADVGSGAAMRRMTVAGPATDAWQNLARAPGMWGQVRVKGTGAASDVEAGTRAEGSDGTSPLRCCHLSDDGSRAVGVTEGGDVALWEVGSPKGPLIWRGLCRLGEGIVAMSSDGHSVVYVDVARSLRAMRLGN